jgi:putative transposase
MSRPPRQHIVGDVHHVMSHSIDSLALFDTNEDQQTFMNILDKHLTKHDCRCYGFALMGNHYHLILRPSDDDFSRMMRNINSAYARYVNKSRGRRGYVFRERFKSIPTRDQNYVRRLILYVHGNPLKSGKISNIKELKGDEFNSHRYLLKEENPYSWLNVGYMQALLSSSGKNFGNAYLEELSGFSLETFDPWEADEDREVRIPTMPSSILGAEAEWLKIAIQKSAEEKCRKVKLQKTPNVIQILLETSCNEFELELGVKSFAKRTKNRNKALSLFAHWAVSICGFPGTFIGRIFGLDGSTILRAAERGRSLAETVAFPIAI